MLEMFRIYGRRGKRKKIAAEAKSRNAKSRMLATGGGTNHH